MKKRDISLDYIRVIATVMIVVFHFASSFVSDSSFFIRTANTTWGGVGTALFFLLSGYLLRKRHYDIASLKEFYKSRWFSIFPPFYIAFIVAYLINVIRLKSFFYQAPAYTLIYTVLGIDNLLKWFGITSYAIVGEWFTGVIVIFYILFPILNKIMKNAKWTASAVLIIMYILDISLEWYPVLPEISFVACLMMFWMGMLLADRESTLRRGYLSMTIGLMSLAIFLMLLIFRVPAKQVIVTHIEAMLLFIGIFTLLKDARIDQRVSKIVTHLSGLSYSVYLVHHYIAFVLSASRKYLDFMNEMPVFAIFLIYILLTALSSYALWFISRNLVRLAGKRK